MPGDAAQGYDPNGAENLMKIVRFGDAGHERPGLIDSSGTLRDLSGMVDEWSGARLGTSELERLARLDHNRYPKVDPATRLGMPLAAVGKFIAIGLNYKDHAEEAKLPIPSEPVIFCKATSSLSGPNDDVVLPRGSKKSDWEVELGVVIGTTSRYVEESDALAHVAGYCLVNDLSEREFQLERGGTWDKGKGCDTFGPIGPWLVTSDDIKDPQDIDLWLEVNGIRRQDGTTRNMIFGVAKLVAYTSCFMTLEPGDILTTGTPKGVGMGMKPTPVFLRAGDRLRVGSSRLGTQEYSVRGFSK
jgi:2-keto-4-pentenoate hydratase/2-oxohepta-3-ene-1,7-dioic acid hydratase in catechol pathway